MVKTGSFKVSQGSTAGRFGAGLGKGLAEQLPKEVQQYRLQQGLKNFSQNAQNLTPLEAATQLFSIPGITPQMAQALPELLRLQQERNIATGMADQGSSENSIASNPSVNTKPQSTSFQNQPRNRESIFDINEKLARETPGLTTQAPYQAALSDIREPTQQEWINKRSQLLKQSPWMSVQAAGDMANDYFKRENAQKVAQIEKGQRQENLQSKTDSEFEKEFQLLTGKGKESIAGESFANMRDAAREEVANGNLTPTQAAKKYSRLALQIDENQNHINQMAETPLITQNPKVIRKNIDNASNLWKEAKRSKELSSRLQEKFQISPEMGNFLSYPPDKDKYMMEVVNSYKPTRPAGLTGLPNPQLASENASKVAQKLSKVNFDENTSLKSIAVALKNKDSFFDDASYWDELNRLYDEGKIKLNTNQREELLNRQTSWIPNLNDWWMKISGGWK